MRSVSLYLLLFILTASCNKNVDDKPVPVQGNDPNIEYTDLHNIVIKNGDARSFDLNNDTIEDIRFGTQIIGEAGVRREKLQFLAVGQFGTFFMMKTGDQSKLFSRTDLIAFSDMEPYSWTEARNEIMVQKISEENVVPVWESTWRNANHQYFGVKIKKDGKFYNGWIELSFRIPEEALVLHRAAVNKLPGLAIFAGE